MISCSEFTTPLGSMLAVARDDQLTGLYFLGQKHFPATPFEPGAATPLLQRTQQQLLDYFAGGRRVFDLPLAPEGTPFQREVWQALLTIPWGGTLSYGAIARGLGRPSASRAVATAIGRNPLCIVIPCHRVIGAGGALTGYAGGLARKQALLELEGALRQI
jgi:methylated-DNA-[protein]-cysteine S-methyltransferase